MIGYKSEKLESTLSTTDSCLFQVLSAKPWYTGTFNLITHPRTHTETHTDTRTHTHTDNRAASKHNLKCKCNNRTREVFQSGEKRLREGWWLQKGEQGERQRGGGEAKAAEEDQKNRDFKGGVKQDVTEGHEGRANKKKEKIQARKRV